MPQFLHGPSLWRNGRLSDCRRQISENRTFGPRRRESVLAHNFRVARHPLIIRYVKSCS